MAYKIKYTPSFRSDLLDQLERFKLFRSERSAEQFYDSITHNIRKLSSNPRIGQISHVSSEKIHSIRTDYDFRIYYRISQTKEVELIRLISTKANPENNPYL